MFFFRECCPQKKTHNVFPPAFFPMIAIYVQHNLPLTFFAVFVVVTMTSIYLSYETPTVSSSVNADNLSMLSNLRIACIAVFSMLTIYDMLEITNPHIDYSMFILSFSTNLPTAVYHISSYLETHLYPNRSIYVSRFLGTRTFYWLPSTTCLILMLHGVSSYKLSPILRNTLVANWMMFLTG